MSSKPDEVVRHRELVQQLQTDALNKLHAAWAERAALQAEVDMLRVKIEIRNQLSRLPEGRRASVLARVILGIIEPIADAD